MRHHPGDPVPQHSAPSGDYAVATHRRRAPHRARRRMRLLGRFVLVVMWGIAVAGVVMFLLNGRQI